MVPLRSLQKLLLGKRGSVDAISALGGENEQLLEYSRDVGRWMKLRALVRWLSGFRMDPKTGSFESIERARPELGCHAATVLES